MEFYVDSSNAPSLIYSPMKRVTVQKQIALDVNLPDYCPDIGRIVDSRVSISAGECFVSKDAKAELRAKFTFCVLYLCDRDSELHKYVFDCEGDAVADTGELKEPIAASISVRGKEPVVRLYGTRKLSVRLDCEFSGVFISKSVHETPENTQDVELLEEKVEALWYQEKKLKAERVSEDIALPQSAPQISEILFCDHVCTSPTVKVEGEHLTVTCDCDFNFVYKDEEGNTKSHTTVIPVTLMEEECGLCAEASFLCDIDLRELRYGVGIDQNGENRVISLDFDATATVNSFENREIGYVKDGYGIKERIAQKTVRESYGYFYGIKEDSLSISESLEDAQGEIESILSLRASPEIRHRRRENGRLFIQGECCAVIFAKCSVGGYGAYEYQLPFEYSTELSDSLKEELFVSIENLSWEKAGTDYRIRADMKIKSAIIEAKVLESVCEFESEGEYEEETGDSALLIYYPDGDDSLWKVAKAHRIPRQAILSANSISEEEFNTRKYLLIPIAK